jgi:hypothetical protein
VDKEDAMIVVDEELTCDNGINGGVDVDVEIMGTVNAPLPGGVKSGRLSEPGHGLLLGP